MSARTASADGKVVGDTLQAQTEQALRNVLAVLAEAGATQATSPS